MVWLENFTRFGMSLIVLPIALIKLSDTEFSVWMMFNTIMGFALLADTGFAPTLMRATAYFRSGADRLPQSISEIQNAGDNEEPNWERIHAIISTSGSLYSLIGFGALLLIGSMGTASIWNLMSLADHNQWLWISFAILMAWALVQVRIARWAGILSGLGNVAVAKRIDILAGALKIVFFSLALYLNLGVLGICCAGFLIVTLNMFLMRRATLCRIIDDQSKPPRFDKVIFKQIWPSTWRQGSINWGAYFITYGSAVVVAQLQDTALISSYLITLRVIILIRQIAQGSITAYMPIVINTLAKRDMVEFRSWTLKIVATSLIVFCFGTAALMLFGDAILSLTGTEKNLVAFELLLLLSLTQLLELHHTIHASLYMATNHVPFLLPAVLSGAFIVGFGFLVIGTHGLLGLILVQAIVQGLCNNWFPVFLSLRISKWKFAEYSSSLIRESFYLFYNLVKSKKVIPKHG
jgi:O-antigen/teichoic acid export membrane protein